METQKTVVPYDKQFYILLNNYKGILNDEEINTNVMAYLYGFPLTNQKFVDDLSTIPLDALKIVLLWNVIRVFINIYKEYDINFSKDEEKLINSLGKNVKQDIDNNLNVSQDLATYFKDSLATYRRMSAAINIYIKSNLYKKCRARMHSLTNTNKMVIKSMNNYYNYLIDYKIKHRLLENDIIPRNVKTLMLLYCENGKIINQNHDLVQCISTILLDTDNEIIDGLSEYETLNVRKACGVFSEGRKQLTNCCYKAVSEGFNSIVNRIIYIMNANNDIRDYYKLKPDDITNMKANQIDFYYSRIEILKKCMEEWQTSPEISDESYAILNKSNKKYNLIKRKTKTKKY